jgi:hypothetical protein
MYGRMFFASLICMAVAACNETSTAYGLHRDGRIEDFARISGSRRERNAAMLAIGAQRGDDCSRPRLIRHFVPGPIEKLRLMQASLPRGTRAQLQSDPPNLIFPEFGRCSVDSLTQRGEEIDKLARPFGLRHDGWDSDFRPR